MKHVFSFFVELYEFFITYIINKIINMEIRIDSKY